MSWLALSLVIAFLAYHSYRWWHTKPIPSSLSTAWAADDRVPLVSFLVPAWNAEAHISGFVAAFKGLNYTRKELILCVGGSDGGFMLAKQFEESGIRVLEQQPGEGKQRALYRSLPLSSGEIIYLTDIDCRLDDTVVAALLRPLLEGEAKVATGSIRPLPEQLDIPLVVAQWAIERLNAWQIGDRSSGLRGANAALYRTALIASGSFSQEASSGTDYTLARELARCGYAISYVRESEMPTEYPGTLAIYVRKQARWLRNVVVLGARYRVWREVRSVTQTLAIPFVLLALMAAGLKHLLFAEIALLTVAHAALNRLRYARMTGLQVSLGGVLSSVFGDLGASLLATSQILGRRFSW